MLWQRGNGTRWNVGGNPGKRCHQNLSVGRFGRKADGRNGLLCSDVDGAGETQEEDYVETAHDMQMNGSLQPYPTYLHMVA